MTAAVESSEPSAAYQRRRLWCGITGIGSILVLLWLAAILGAPAWLDRSRFDGPPEVVGALTALVLGVLASLVQAGPDYVAVKTEQAFEQQTQPVLVPYLVHVLQWLGGITTAGAVVGFCIRVGGDQWHWLAMPGLLTLAFFHVIYPLSPTRRSKWQGDESEIRREVESADLTMPKLSWFEHGERSLAGGWNGVGPRRRLFVSETLRQVSPRVAASLVIREIGHLRLKHRLVTTICTIGWIVIGLLLARWIAGSERSVAAVVFIIAATMSTWCWLGLLGLWPTLGKRQIYAADRFAAIHLGKADALVMLDVLASRNLPDRTLPSGVAFVFHPIPPMDLRRQRIKSLP